MRIPHRALGLLAALSAACVSTTTTSRTWGEPGGPWPERHGRVAWINETVEHQQGSPAGGAAVGAVIGGLFGNAMTGRAGGTLLGATAGAAVGASASQGSAESRDYRVAVRFDDGEQRVFLFRAYCPFRVGDSVVWTSQGLARSAAVAGAPYPPPGAAPPPPPGVVPPPPPALPPPPPGVAPAP